MNIQFVTTGNFPHVGGKSSHIETILRGLRELGNDCRIVSYSDMSSWSNKLVFAKRLVNAYKRFIDFDDYARKSDDIIKQEFKKTVIEKLGKYKYDVIVAEDPVAAIIATEIQKDKPVVLVMHSYFGRSMSIVGKGRFSTSASYFERQKNEQIQVLKKISKLIAVDDRIRKECSDYANIVNGKLKVVSIENFVDTEKYKKKLSANEIEIVKKNYGVEGKKVITCVRRLCDKNGVIFAVKAMETLPDEFVLLVAGDGDCMQAILKEIEEHQLQSKVKMLGSANSERVIELYNISDYITVPSITLNGLQEATSISALEAMSFGVPVVASSIGGLKQMIQNEKSGMLVEEQKPDEIAAAILKLDSDKCLYKTVSRNGRQEVIDKYSYLVGAQRYYEEISKL